MSWFFPTIATPYQLGHWCCSSSPPLSTTIWCKSSFRSVTLVVNSMIVAITFILKACEEVRFLVTLEGRLIVMLLLLIVTLHLLNLTITTFVSYHAGYAIIITYSLGFCSHSTTLSTAKPVVLRFLSFPFCYTLTVYTRKPCFYVLILWLTF